MTEQIGYRETYRIRRTFPGKKFTEVTLPYKVVEREARMRGLSFDEFIKRFQVVAEYNNFEGVIYKFEEAPLKSETEQEGTIAIEIDKSEGQNDSEKSKPVATENPRAG